MTKQVLFIQGGGGEEDYAADAKLVASLRENLGDGYAVHYPRLPTGPEPDFGRQAQIEKAVSSLPSNLVLVGHSLGASMLLKYLSETPGPKRVAGVFLLATPFWSGPEDWKQGFILHPDFAGKLPQNLPVYFYHCEDDEVVPFTQLGLYAQRLPQAIIRPIPHGGHQFNDDAALVARDIKAL